MLIISIHSFERSENVLYAVAPLTGGKIQNAIWPKIWMLIFILGQNKLKQAKKKSTRPGRYWMTYQLVTYLSYPSARPLEP